MAQTQDYDMSLQKASSMEEVAGSKDKVKMANSAVSEKYYNISQK